VAAVGVVAGVDYVYVVDEDVGEVAGCPAELDRGGCVTFPDCYVFDGDVGAVGFDGVVV